MLRSSVASSWSAASRRFVNRAQNSLNTSSSPPFLAAGTHPLGSRSMQRERTAFAHAPRDAIPDLAVVEFVREHGGRSEVAIGVVLSAGQHDSRQPGKLPSSLGAFVLFARARVPT